MNPYRHAFIRDTLLWGSLVVFAGTLLFLAIGPETCYSVVLCYEISSIFKIYNYVTSLAVLTGALLICSLYSKTKSHNLGYWLTFTVIWTPLSVAFSALVGGGTTGWIPTSPGSGTILTLLSMLYVVLSVAVLSVTYSDRPRRLIRG